MEIALTLPGMSGTPIDSGLPVPTGGLEKTGANSIQAFLILAVIAAIAVALWFILVGGWDIIISRGHKEQFQKGRDRIVFALLGLLYIFISFIFIGLISRFLGFSLLPFVPFFKFQ